MKSPSIYPLSFSFRLVRDQPQVRASYSSSPAHFRYSRRRAYSPHESPPPQRGTSTCRADADSLPLRDTLCRLDPQILRPFPEFGATRVRLVASAACAPVPSTSWQRTTPVPVVPPQRQLASKPKRNGANASQLLRVSDTAADESRRVA
jgi:hypothetical protein